MSLPQRPSLAPLPAASSAPANRTRQYAHLGAQLAQLHARLADLENLVRMTGVQASDVRGLGGWMGGLFMASSRILGEGSLAESQGALEAAAALARAEAAERGTKGRKEGEGDAEQEEEEQGGAGDEEGGA